MTNQQIAPMAQLSIDERIQELESFLQMQEYKLAQPPLVSNVVEEVKAVAPVAPVSPVSTVGPVSPVSALEGNDVITLLRKISENQEIDRKRYERFNPISNDEAIYDWAEATINPGQLVQFIYTVGEGRVFYLQYPNITHNVETTYSIWIDGEYQPNLSQSLIDFGDHQIVYSPPKMCYNNVQVWALNNWIAPQTYDCFIRGFSRWLQKIHREIKYESLEKEETEQP